MTDKEIAFRMANVNKLNENEARERIKQLDSKELVGLSDADKAEYLVLKLKFEGKESFLGNSSIVIVLQDLIMSWIDKGMKIPDSFSGLFVMCHVDWLIDWAHSSETNIEVRQDIIDNMQTYIIPFLEEIEEILGETYKTRTKPNLNSRIVGVVEELLNYSNKEKLPSIYNALFKMKYAFQAAREYMGSDNKKSIKVGTQNYELDIQSVAHIFLRHTERFKTLSHKDNKGKRGFIHNELGNEFEKLNYLLNQMELKMSVNNDGVYSCQIEGNNYKIVLKDHRIVTLYPLV